MEAEQVNAFELRRPAASPERLIILHKKREGGEETASGDKVGEALPAQPEGFGTGRAVVFARGIGAEPGEAAGGFAQAEGSRGKPGVMDLPEQLTFLGAEHGERGAARFRLGPALQVQNPMGRDQINRHGRLQPGAGLQLQVLDPAALFEHVENRSICQRWR